MTIEEEIKALIETAMEAIGDQSGEQSTRQSLFYKRTIDRFEHKKGNVSLQWSTEIVPASDSGLATFSANAIALVRQDLVDEPLQRRVANHFGVTPDRVRDLFVRVMMHIASQGRGRSVDEYFMWVMRDLDNSPCWWHFTVGLMGVYVDSDPVEFDGFIIRPPGMSDFEELVPLYGSVLNQHHNGEFSNSYLEMSVRCVSEDEANEKIEDALIALKLAGVGSVAIYQRQKSVESFLRGGFDARVSHPGVRHPSRKYGITKSTVPVVNNLIGECVGSIRGYSDVSGEEPGGKSVKTAFHRYCEAIGGEIGEADRLAKAASCLESLYLKASERTELSHKLSQRVALMMSLLGDHPVKTYKEFLEIYDLRSIHLHGARLSKPQLDGMKPKVDRLLDVCRRSILVFASVGGDKDKLVTKVDNALLMPNARGSLQQTVSELAVFPAVMAG